MTAVPPVSYSALLSGRGFGYNEALDNLARSMDPKHFGFFILTETEHVIPLDLRRLLARDTEAFFALPSEMQMQFYYPETGGQRGVTPYGEERGVGALIGDPKRHFMFGPEGVEPAPNISCKEVPTLKKHALEVFYRGQKMAFVMYGALATVADVDPKIFEAYQAPYTVPNSSLRGIEYTLTEADLDMLLQKAAKSEKKEERELAARVRENPSLLYRAFPHTDIDDFTFVLREERRDRLFRGSEESGLEMVTKEGVIPVTSEYWHDLACNLGDDFNVRTGWPSTTHQVGFSRNKRYSWPLFFHPPRGSGLALLRSEARSQYVEKFIKLYGAEVYGGLTDKEQENIGKNEIQILYDHFLLLRLVEIRLKQETDLKTIHGKPPPLQEPLF